MKVLLLHHILLDLYNNQARKNNQETTQSICNQFALRERHRTVCHPGEVETCCIQGKILFLNILQTNSL